MRGEVVQTVCSVRVAWPGADQARTGHCGPGREKVKVAGSESRPEPSEERDYISGELLSHTSDY